MTFQLVHVMRSLTRGIIISWPFDTFTRPSSNPGGSHITLNPAQSNQLAPQPAIAQATPVALAPLFFNQLPCGALINEKYDRLASDSAVETTRHQQV